MHVDSLSAHPRCYLNVGLTPKSGLVVLLAVEYPENGKEQIDDVQVERDSRSNLLFDMIVTHNELGVHQNVTTEDEGCHRSVNKLGRAIVWKEGCNESKKDEYP